MKKALFLLSLVLFSQCSLTNKKDDNDDDVALALLLGMSADCVIGGQAFIPSAGVTCSNGSASGTGTLTAIGNKDEVFMQLTPSIGTGGYLRVFTYAPANNITDSSSVGVEINTSELKNYQHIESFSQSGSKFCLEYHGEHHHLLYKAEACSTAQADGEAEFDGWNQSQEAWGFELKNATLSNVTFFGDGSLGHPQH